MSEPRPPLADARAKLLLTALRQSPPPELASEPLLARIHREVQRGALPAFADQVLPSSKLEVMWLGMRTKLLLLCGLSAGLMAYGLTRDERSAPATALRAVPVQHPAADALTPIVMPLRAPMQLEPAVEQLETMAALAADTPAPEAPAPPTELFQTARARSSSTRRATRTQTSHVSPQPTRVATTGEPAVEEPTEVHVGLTQLQPHDPRDLEEMRRVADAEQLLMRAPADTLRMVREDNQRFRDGYFHEERRYLEIMALIALGKADDARLLARQFLKRYARGAYRARVEEALR